MTSTQQQNHLRCLSPFSIEMNLLLVFLNNNIKREQLDNYKSKQIDWGKFLQLTLHHRVFPNIYIVLNDLNLEWIPDKVMSNLKYKYEQNVFSMLKLTSEQENIGKLFHQNSIKALFLKGPVLAADLYGDISSRTSRDIDILVPFNQLERVQGILVNEGYVKEQQSYILLEKKWRMHHEEYTHHEKNIKIEIHWRLHNNLLEEPSFDDLWYRKRSIKLGRTELFMLGREDLFLFLITHGARHGWFRLRWLVDIDKFMRDSNVEWEYILKISKKYVYEDVLGQSILLAQNLLSASIPANSSIKQLIEKKSAKKLAKLAIVFIVNKKGEKVFPGNSKSFYYYYNFILQSKISKKLIYILMMLCPTSKDAKVLPLPKALHFLYFPLRPMLVVGRRLRLSKGNN